MAIIQLVKLKRTFRFQMKSKLLHNLVVGDTMREFPYQNQREFRWLNQGLHFRFRKEKNLLSIDHFQGANWINRLLVKQVPLFFHSTTSIWWNKSTMDGSSKGFGWGLGFGVFNFGIRVLGRVISV